MSLHHAAQHLSAQGRGPDTTLVHMSKGEVKSLNDLAMAHGGHLTINPHTGLPEAGFLSRILPMVAGAALASTGIGAPAAAMIVGGGYAAASGSLKKGLMAGLGAYGGAGLAGSLTAAGAPSVVPEATAPAAPVTDPTAAVNPMRGGFSTTPQAVAGVQSGSPLGGVGYTSPASVVPTPAAPPVEVTPAPTTVTTTNLPPAFNPAQPAASFDASKFAPAPVVETAAAPVAAPAVNPAPVTTDYSNYLGGSAQTGAGANSAATLSPENMTTSQRLQALKSGATFENIGNWAKQNPLQAAGMAVTALTPDEKPRQKPYSDSDPGQQYNYEANATSPTPMADPFGREQKYFNQRYVARAGGGPVEAMSNANAIGANTGYPMADINKGAYATPWQTPISRNVIADTSDTGVNPITGEMTNFARGGLSDAQYNLGGYSDGGRLLRGPGDGVSDSIPAVIGKKQPARLADGEFVVPARIVSELGNGSTEAGARKLYAMMDRIQAARGKTVGKGKVAKNSRADKYLPA